jgi:hypothetical protein
MIPRSIACLAFLFGMIPAVAQDAATTPPATDWLLAPDSFKARVTEDKAQHRLILDNGLARRVFLLGPNAATIDLQNLTSGERYLRAIAPEARVKIDGVDYEVGGLKGAPIANYINAAWLGSLTADPAAYRYTGYTVGETLPRFAWKKRPEWLAKDLPWPPPGKHLVMRYDPPAMAPQTLGGPVVLELDFAAMPHGTKLEASWKELKSPGFDRASFYNEGKVGEVMAAAAGSACVEHAWPATAKSVEVLMDSGDDNSAAWGPGLALIIDGRAHRFATRPGESSYEVDGKAAGAFDRNKPCRLRVRLDGAAAICEAAQGERSFAIIGVIPCPQLPSALRLGKVGMDGSGESNGADTAPVRSHISKVVWRGAEAVVPTSVPPNLPAVEVHYELYDGIPLMQKWIEVVNHTAKTVRLDRFVAEELRIAENEMSSGQPPEHEHPNLHVETDMAFGSSMNPYYCNPAVSLEIDPDYPTQVNYSRQTKCLLKCQPPAMGPAEDIKPGERFTSLRAFVLLLDSSERERRTLAQRRMYRTVAPWSAQNPFMFHKVQSDPATVRDAIDQAAEVGFDMVIMSFGSGFNFESRDANYIARYQKLCDYAKTKGIALGGYSLLASRGAGTPQDNTQGQPTAFGKMPCLGAQWGRDYLATLKNFMATAGFAVLEHDGSYPGDRCAATNHPYHHGLEDSQWVQWRAISGLYQWCTANGVYLNIPDWYFLAGGTKCAMHYREANYGLPRAEQILVERQGMFDGTWEKCASQGWMFIPLSSYNGGPASTIEPLDQHRDHYNERFADLIGYGVQACYRGPRLFDSEATKAIVKKWTAFYKAHREVLDGDIIHLRRANGLDWDGIVHVNPQGKERAMMFLYNPLAEEITREIRVPLYYAGLKGAVQTSVGGGAAQPVKLDDRNAATLTVKIPAQSHQWVLFTE